MCCLTGCLQEYNRTLSIPESLSGNWKAKEQVWEIKIGPEGRVESVLIPMGEIWIRPNQINTMKMIDGKISTFEAVNFEASYDPDLRELFAKISVPYFHVKIGNDFLEGNFEDVFVGPVTSDGKRWDAIWFHFFDYGERFPMDPNVAGVPVEFRKLESD